MHTCIYGCYSPVLVVSPQISLAIFGLLNVLRKKEGLLVTVHMVH